MAMFGEDSMTIIVKARDEASKVFTELESKFKKTSDNLTSAGKKLTAGLTAPIAALGTGAVIAAGKFEKSMGDLATLLGDGTDAMATFESGLKDVIKTSPKSADDLGASAYSIVSAGITDADQALQVLRSSSDLAVAGLSTTAEATDLLTTAINAFGLDAGDADEVANVLFKTVKAGKTTVADMTQAFGKMAGNASAAGISLEDVQAATAALTTVTGKTSESQNALAQVFLELTVSGGKLDKGLQSAGGSLEDLNAVIAEKGLVDGMESLRDELGLTDTEFKNLFSSAEGGTAVFQLLTSANKAAKDTYADLKDEANALEGAVKVQNEQFQQQWQLMKNKLNIALIELGQVIMPALKDIMEKVASGVQALAGWFSELSPTMQRVVVVVALILAALGPFLIILGQIIAIAPAVGAAFTVMMGPVGVAILGIAALVAVGVALYKNWDRIKEAGTGVWDWIKEKIVGAFDAVSGAFGSFIGVWQAGWDLLGEIVKTTVAFFTGILFMFLDWFFPGWRENVQLMIDAWIIGWEYMSNKVAEMLAFINEKIGAAFGWAKGFILGFLGEVGKKWEDIWKKASDFFVSIWTPVKEAITSVIDVIVTQIQRAIDMYNRLKSMIGGGIKSVGESIGNFVGSAVSKGNGALGFEHGGIVPGPRGMAVPVIAHGQERIIPAGGAASGGGQNMTVVIQNPVYRNNEDERRMKEQLDQYFRPLIANHKLSL